MTMTESPPEPTQLDPRQPADALVVIARLLRHPSLQLSLEMHELGQISLLTLEQVVAPKPNPTLVAARAAAEAAKPTRRSPSKKAPAKRA